MEHAEPTTEPALVGIRLRSGGRVSAYDAAGVSVAVGDTVIVGTERGTALGTVVVAPWAIAPPPDLPPQRILKKADARDLARDDANEVRARDALKVCLQRVRERQMPMKIVKAERLLDGSKIVFYFASEGRIDFRDLVRDLAHLLRSRIEMKQIGSRDETKVVGGVGPCGRELCCSSWITEFSPVSLKMAKEQGLSLNPSKLAGMCGRLKCCLRYEYDTYLELGRALPPTGRRVVSVKGDGIVVRQHILKQTVVIKLDDGKEVEASLDDLVQKKAD